MVLDKDKLSDEDIENGLKRIEENRKKDIILDCLQKIGNAPTREQIINELPPLGKAALAYNPKTDDFFNLMERYKVSMSTDEYTDFAYNLFFNTLSITFIDKKNPYELFARTASCWYEYFGLQSRIIQSLVDKENNPKLIFQKKKELSHRLGFYGYYGYYIGEWFWESFQKFEPNSWPPIPNKEELHKMADDFFESLPYNTGRLINKLIVEATGEHVDLPFEVAKTDVSANISIDNPFPVYVYTKVCHCIKCEQKYGVKTICNRKAIVQTAQKQWVTIGIQYCQGCNSGFINQEILDTYNKKYGHLLFERSYSDAEKTAFAAKGLAKDSILSRCGYSVEKGITKEYRQDVLAYVLDSQKATKAEVQELLSFFIRFHKQSSFAHARQCWRDDLTFVVNYKIDSQPLMGKAVFKER